jgi:hypothetical protein
VRGQRQWFPKKTTPSVTTIKIAGNVQRVDRLLIPVTKTYRTLVEFTAKIAV